MIKFEDVVASNDSEIMKHRDEFVNYHDVLPIAIDMWVDPIQRGEFEESHNLREKAYNKRMEHRKSKDPKFILKDLVRWVNDNPEYKHLLIFK